MRDIGDSYMCRSCFKDGTQCICPVNEVEEIINKSKIYLLWLNHISEQEAVELFDDYIKNLAKTLNDYVVRARIEENKRYYFVDSSDIRIAELEKQLQSNEKRGNK